MGVTSYNFDLHTESLNTEPDEHFHLAEVLPVFPDQAFWRHLGVLVLIAKGQITTQVNNMSPKISYISTELVKKKESLK